MPDSVRSSAPMLPSSREPIPGLIGRFSSLPFLARSTRAACVRGVAADVLPSRSSAICFERGVADFASNPPRGGGCGAAQSGATPGPLVRRSTNSPEVARSGLSKRPGDCSAAISRSVSAICSPIPGGADPVELIEAFPEHFLARSTRAACVRGVATEERACRSSATS